MESKMSNLDIKSEHIEEYIRFMSSSLAPSSIRLLKLDIIKFYSWFITISGDKQGMHSLDIVDSYKKCVLKNEPTAVANRKLNSALRFLSWIEAQAPHLVNQVKVKGSTKSAKSNVVILSLKAKVLFTFLILSTFPFILYFLLIPRDRENSTIVQSLKRFHVYIPVVSDALPPSLKRSVYKLKIYGDETSSKTSLTLLCNAKVSFFNSKPIIFIDSGVGCKQLAHTDGDSISALKEYFIDIIVGTTKINNKRIVVNNTQYNFNENGNLQSQNTSKTIIGRQSGSLINSQDTLIPKFDSIDSNIDTRPISNVYVPLSLFEVSDAQDSDVVSLSSSQLSRSILNSSVLGVVEGKNVVMSGKTLVNVSDKSEPISIGDYVAVGLEPGKVIKASLGYDNIIGVALESWPNDKNKINTLLVR